MKPFNGRYSVSAFTAFILCWSLILYILKFWQLEMVWVGYATGWGYNFGGFGSLGLQIYNWRDFWWFIECACFIMFGYAMFQLGKNGKLR